MRRLILFRHAKSAWPNGLADHARPLASRGEQAAPLMAQALLDAGLKPERVVVSTALRTQQTFALMQPVLQIPRSEVFEDSRIYEAGISSLMETVRETPASCRSLMLVGHNPGMAELTFFLSNPTQSDHVALARLSEKFPTAAAAVLEFGQEDWRVVPRHGVLTHFITPRQVGGVDED